jgi:hypothetical protein
MADRVADMAAIGVLVPLRRAPPAAPHCTLERATRRGALPIAAGDEVPPVV